MKIYSAIAFIILPLLFASVSAKAEVAVVVHPKNNLDSISNAALKKIYLGKTKKFPNGVLADPVDMSDTSGAYDTFYTKYVKKSSAQLQSYWSRMIFSGNGVPPHRLDSQDMVKEFVAKNQNAIGYIDPSLVDNSVKKIDVK